MLRFDGSVPANPELDITAEATLTGLNATIHITGTSAAPIISFTSVPAMPQDEVLSRLLFGSSITQLSAPEALQLASAVASLRGGKGGLDPINAIRKAAGLDRLRILPADQATGQGTAIGAGKYITRKIYVELISDGQGYSATRLEYQVTRWLSLLSSISTLGRQSITARVSKDY
jgi:translocation and assembly module TamB